MFRSRSKRRQNPSTWSSRGPLRQLSQRLGVEALERRMMLAATGLDMEPAAMSVAQFSFDNTPVGFDQSALRKIVVSRPAERPEGGYLNTLYNSDFLETRYAGDFIISTGVSGASSDNAEWTTGDGLLIDVMQSDVNLNAANLSSRTSAYDRNQFDADGLDIFSGGIEPVNIPATQSSPETPSNTKTNVALNNGDSGESIEGGPISIPVILASREAVGGSPFEPATSTRTLAADESTRIEITSHSASDSLALNAVAAEWARAMVLETAGGEPDSAIPTSSVHEDTASRNLEVRPSARSGEPLSSELPSANAQQTDASDTRSAPTGQAASSGAQSPTPFVAASLEGIALPDANGNATVGPDQHFSQAAVASVPNAAISGVPDLVVDAAFEKVGDSEDSLLQSMAAASWHRPLAAAPLLMMLALERIAAGNSRRANREAVAVTASRRNIHRLGDDDDRS